MHARGQLRPRTLAALLALAPLAPAAPGDTPAFTLFNPVPREQLRPLSADRPDATESPFTVDAGRVQIELSFADLSLDRDSSERTRSVAIAPVLVKVGLLSNIDLQLGIDPYTRTTVTSRESGERETFDGFGDMLLRLKVNLWGNDEGPTALALMSFLKFPTAGPDLGNGRFEGGLILPFAVAVGPETSIGLMLELDVVRSRDNRRYVLDLIHTATIATTLAGPVGGFVEYAGASNLNGDAGYRASMITGLTRALSDDLVLDGGIRVGLTPAAENFGLFAGMTVRF